MGKTRNQRRTDKIFGVNWFYLYPAETILGWRVIRMVTGARGEEMLARGEWRDVYDENGRHIGYQILSGTSCEREVFTSSYSCSVTITISEIIKNAGVCFPRGKSLTAGLPEEKRITRTRPDDGKKLPPEDAVELAQAKVALWPFPASRIDDGKGEPVYGDRACRVYPKT